MKKLVVFNLGLLVGKSNNLIDKNNYLKALKKLGGQTVFNTVKNGIFEGEQEPTLIAYAYFGMDVNVNKICEHLCEQFGQICIPFWLPNLDFGELVYAPNYRGDKYNFDKQYFEVY